MPESRSLFRSIGGTLGATELDVFYADVLSAQAVSGCGGVDALREWEPEKGEPEKVSGTVYLSFGLPCGREVISRPSFLVAVVAHVSSPNGVPRLTLRRMAASSASV